MVTFIQVLLAIVISTLTFLVAMAGIQVFYILQEFRHTLKRVNRILDNTHTLSQSAAKPVTAVNQFFSEVRHLVTEVETEIIDSTEDRVITSPQPHRTGLSRFFHRSGSPLRPS